MYCHLFCFLWQQLDLDNVQQHPPTKKERNSSDVFVLPSPAPRGITDESFASESDKDKIREDLT